MRPTPRTLITCLFTACISAALLGAADPGVGEPEPDPGDELPSAECHGVVRPDIEVLMDDVGASHAYFPCSDEVYIGTMPRVLQVSDHCEWGFGSELETDLCAERGEVFFERYVDPTAPLLGIPMIMCCGEGEARYATYFDSELDTEPSETAGNCKWADLAKNDYRTHSPTGMGFGGCVYNCDRHAGIMDDESALVEMCLGDVLAQWVTAKSDVLKKRDACYAWAEEYAKTLTDDEEYQRMIEAAFKIECDETASKGLAKVDAQKVTKDAECNDLFSLRLQLHCDNGE